MEIPEPTFIPPQNIPSQPNVITTNEELGDAIKRGEDTIIIEGGLKDKIIRVKATGKVAWAIAIGAIAIAVTSVIARKEEVPTTQTGKAITFTGSAAGTAVAAGILGKASIAAIGIAVAAGGIGALTSLRDNYKITSNEGDRLILSKK